MNKKYVGDFKVTRKESYGAEYCLLILQSNTELPAIKPGQFVQVEVPAASGSVFLRRPFSVHDVLECDRAIAILVKKVGVGTRRLLDLKIGEVVNMVYPLGDGVFSVDGGLGSLLVGGGIGSAPLLYLARQMAAVGERPHIVLGGRSKTDILRHTSFAEFATVGITTDDGSLGVKGVVLDHPFFQEVGNKFHTVAVCGPERMMRAVAALVISRKARCFVSLENMMACGIGACLCCVTKTTTGHRCVCTEGPVFDARELEWT